MFRQELERKEPGLRAKCIFDSVRKKQACNCFTPLHRLFFVPLWGQNVPFMLLGYCPIVYKVLLGRFSVNGTSFVPKATRMG